MRLFVALRLSGEANSALLRAQKALGKQGAGRFTYPENFHLTIVFIGETQRINDAAAALSEISLPPFSLCVKKAGSFGDIYWAGAELTPPLQNLYQQVTKALYSNGFILEDCPYRPHLTLARQFKPRDKLDLSAVEKALGEVRCEIHEVYLMESTRINGKLVYRPIASKKLQN